MVTIHFCPMENSSLDIVLSISSCVLPKKESHRGFETHEDEWIVEFSFCDLKCFFKYASIQNLF